MALRLLLIFAFTLVLGAVPGMSAADEVVVVVVEHEGETTGDLDEAQVAMGEAVLVSDDHAIPRAIPVTSAPSPPHDHGVFRPPRAAFD